MAVYGRESLASDFKLTWENDDLLSSRHKQIFEVPHPVQEYTKCGFQTKGIELIWFVLFEVLGVPQLGGTWV